MFISNFANHFITFVVNKVTWIEKKMFVATNLTVHNWQENEKKKKKKVDFLHVSAIVCRVEAVGLSISSYTLKTTIFVNNEILGNFMKFDILSISAWLKFQSKIPFVSLWISTTHLISFLLNRYLDKYRFSFSIFAGFCCCFFFFCFFFLFFFFLTVKSPCVTQRSIPQENAFKKSKNSSPFSAQNCMLK